MAYVNALYEHEHTADDIKTLLVLLAPYAPFITEELWHRVGEEGSVHEQPWPSYEEGKIKTETIQVVVQVNGKVRAQVEVPADVSGEELEREALKHDNVQKYLEGKEPKKVIVVKGRLVNVVV
jgi:leucyl-tRNA synthetase